MRRGVRAGTVRLRGIKNDHIKEVFSLKECLELFLTFAKVGVMTFGGGMAMLPILQREVVENKG